MNDGVEQQAYCVDKNVPLLALDLLARIVPVRINARPPFSALFTLWLSMMAAVGLAFRWACSDIVDRALDEFVPMYRHRSTDRSSRGPSFSGADLWGSRATDNQSREHT